jgi:hypothetical protein
MTETKRNPCASADLCRAHGWIAGTLLLSQDGHQTDCIGTGFGSSSPYQVADPAMSG